MMISHGLQRGFVGEKQGKPIADWLNRHAKNKTGRRVAKLVKQLKKLAPGFSFEEWYEKRQRREFMDGYVPEFRELNRELRKYPTWPLLLWRVTTADLLSKRKGKLEARSCLSSKWSSGGKPGAAIVHAIVNLAGDGLLSSLSECINCKNWFYARFSHHRFCSERCRVKHFRTSPDWKSSRCLYMRRYRERRRERDISSIAIAKRNSRPDKST